MPDFFTPDIMRMVERVLTVAGGILAVYLAYRLFSIATIRNEPGPRFKSALVEFGVCRVAPAVFFAGLGAYILYASLEKPVASPYASANAPPILTVAEWDRLAAAIDKLPTRAERDDAKRLLATARAKSSRGGTTGSVDRRPGSS
jgi:hypothetical protein